MFTTHAARRPRTRKSGKFQAVALFVQDGAARCPNCGQVLDLHQPGQDDPTRIIAFCQPDPAADGCGSLFFLDGFGEPGGALAVELPRLRTIPPATLQAECPAAAISGE